MSNRDFQVAASQSLAQQAFQAELAAAQAAGNVVLCQYWMKHLAKNNNNQLYARP